MMQTQPAVSTVFQSTEFTIPKLIDAIQHLWKISKLRGFAIILWRRPKCNESIFFNWPGLTGSIRMDQTINNLRCGELDPKRRGCAKR